MVIFPALSRLNDWHCDAWYYFGPMIAPAAISPSWGRVMATAPFSFLPAFGLIDYVEQFFWFSTVLIATIGLYVALSTFFLPLAAAVAAMLVCFSGFTLSIASTTYLIPAVAYGAVALAFVCRSVVATTSTGRFARLFFAGMFLAFAVNCHVWTAFAFAPFTLLALIRTGSEDRPFLQRASMALAGLIVGATAGVLATCALYLVIYGDFWKATLQITSALDYIGGAHNYDVTQWTVAKWWTFNSVIPTGVLLMLCLIFVAQDVRHGSRESKIALTFALVGAGTYAASFALSLSNRSILMMHSYYLIWYGIPVALTLCSVLDRIMRRNAALFTRPVLHQIAVGGTMLASLVLFWQLRLIVQWEHQFLLVAACSVAAFASQWRFSARPAALLLIYLLLPTTFQTVRPTGYGADFWVLPRDQSTAAMYSAAKESIRFIANHANGQVVNFWVSKAAQQQVAVPIFRSFIRCGFTPGFPDSLPDSTEYWQHPLTTGESVVILMAPDEAARNAENTLRAAGLRYDETTTRMVSNPPYAMNISIGRLSAIPE
jgi:hypothetical protein